MAQEGIAHEIPSEFTDEDRWLNLFSTKSFSVLGAGSVFTLALYKIFGFISLHLVGGVIGFVITVIATGTTMVPKMGDDYMKGGGTEAGSSVGSSYS